MEKTEHVNNFHPVHVGTSGWNYESFIGTIYEPGTPKRRYLETYAKFFDTVELNASFYRSFPEKTWRGWYSRTPEDFLWSVKASRFITHIRRLDVERASIDMFFDKVSLLGEKLGAVLFQLPPGLKYNEQVFLKFLDLLPRHVKIALEARHSSWFSDRMLERLKDRNIAWTISELAGRYPMLETFTADFTYIRLHGHSQLYRGLYGRQGLQKWVDLVRASEREAFVYFDNTDDGSAAKDALIFLQMLEEEGVAGFRS